MSNWILKLPALPILLLAALLLGAPARAAQPLASKAQELTGILGMRLKMVCP